MSTFSDLRSALIATTAHFERHDRLYKLTDTFALEVLTTPKHIHSHEPDGTPVDGWDIAVSMALLEYAPATEDLTAGYDEVDDIAKMPAQVLARLAEVKGTVDAWVKGDLADLPISTINEAPRCRFARGRR